MPGGPVEGLSGASTRDVRHVASAVLSCPVRAIEAEVAETSDRSGEVIAVAVRGCGTATVLFRPTDGPEWGPISPVVPSPGRHGRPVAAAR